MTLNDTLRTSISPGFFTRVECVVKHLQAEINLQGIEPSSMGSKCFVEYIFMRLHLGEA